MIDVYYWTTPNGDKITVFVSPALQPVMRAAPTSSIIPSASSLSCRLRCFEALRFMGLEIAHERRIRGMFSRL